MKNLARVSALSALLLAFPAHAQTITPPAPDDVVFLDLSTEGFVTTQTANVTVTVTAAASDERAPTLRADMQKAAAGLAGRESDWRLTSFNRSQDQSGLTRWDAVYEARLPESNIGNLSEKAQKASRPGMTLRVAGIDFTPTLAETEARRSELRADLYKRANDELARLNTTLPGRAYRIGDISFNGEMAAPMPVAIPRMMMKAMAAPMMAESVSASAPAGAEVAQHLTVTAHVTFAAHPPTQTAR